MLKFGITTMLVVAFFAGNSFLHSMKFDNVMQDKSLMHLKNFSWIDKHVAGMAYPPSEKALESLEQLNIGLIVTLTEEPIPFTKQSIKIVHIPVKDYSVPTFDQVNQVIDAIDGMLIQDKSAVIHCQGGCGRTGTMLACWLVAKHNFEPNDAIKQIRTLRPSSIETEDQENFITAFSKTL